MNSFKYLNFWLALWSLAPASFSVRHFPLISCCCYFSSFCFNSCCLLLHSLPHSPLSVCCNSPGWTSSYSDIVCIGNPLSLFSALLIPHQHLAKGKNPVRASTVPPAAWSAEDESRALPLPLNSGCEGKPHQLNFYKTNFQWSSAGLYIMLHERQRS